jgi:hypothetical protein
LRISPQSEHSAAIIRLFRNCIEQKVSCENALQQMESMMPEAACNGYWHGRPGMEQMFLASAMQYE